MTAGRAEPAPLRRLWRYLAERFPLGSYIPLISAFTFSSAAYSRLARGAPGFIPWPRFVVGAWTAIAFFLLLRVLDEHKDADLDRRFRPELPVPRGLVTLGELRALALVALLPPLALNAWMAPVLLLPCAAFGAWAALMTREFFVRDWLRRHHTAYLLSHMAIMPMIDAYTTGLDWLVEGAHPPGGLGAFLAVTFLNGCVIEIGRKLRAPGDEREGVDTYTRLWGTRRAAGIWLGVLALTGATAWVAARHTGAGAGTAAVLLLLLLAAAAPAAAFARRPTPALARRVEQASGLWPLASYLLLGAGPFLARLLSR